MVYEIQEISTDKASGMTYVLVHYWADDASRLRGDEPLLVNDHLMPLTRFGTRAVTNAQGQYRLTSGAFVDADRVMIPVEVDRFDKVTRQKIGTKTVLRTRPDLARETFERPLALEIAANLEGYMRGAEQLQYSGDQTGDGSKPFYVAGRLVPKTTRPIARDSSDPHGVHAHPAVAALRAQVETRKQQRAARGGGPPR